jgi:two-component system, sensor histidine kinase and response regulator
MSSRQGENPDERRRRDPVSEDLKTTFQGNEEFFRSIFESAQIGIGIYNIQTGEHFSNQAMHEMLGYTPEELSRTGQWDEIIHPDERVSGGERYAELIQGSREQDEWEQRFIRRDGGMVIANGRFKLVRDAGGKPKYIVGLNEDITERRLAEAERRRVTKQMQLLLDSTGQGVYGVDLEGKCTFINRATCEMTGHRPEEVLGRNMHELVHHHKPDGSLYPVEECPVSQALRDGKGYRTEEEVLWRRDGAAIPVEYSSFPVVEDEGIRGAVVTVSDITERKRANEVLQSSERLFRSIFENAQIGIGVFKIGSQEHFSNRALREMLGYTEKELSRLEEWDQIVPPEERAFCAQRYAELVQGKREKDEYQQHFIRRDGRIILGNSRFQLLRDSSGKPQYVVALTEDVTERELATEALAASEQLFRSVFENAQIGIGIFNIQSGEHFSNRATHEMLGYSQEELSRIGQWDEIVHPDERASGGERYAELIQGRREKDEWEQRFIRRDGGMVIANGRFKLVRDARGQPKYVVALNEDITERRRAHEALASSERLFRSIFENAQIGISFFSVDGRENFTNRALHEMLGYSEKELRNIEQWDNIIEPGERAEGASRYAELLAGRRDNDEWVQHFIRRDGRIVTANGRFTLLRDSAGKPQYVASLTEDITKRTRIEAELVKAKEVAEAATKSKSEFLANMSHEIRTPMNAILGMTYLALKTELTAKQRDYLTRVKAAAEALLSIINDILDFSKIEAGKLDMEQTDFRLDVVLDNLSTVISQRAHEKNLEFLVAPQPDLPVVLVGDPLRLGQVLINLVNNALKFTERGEVVVTVQLEEQVSNRVKLKFMVRDSGVGMTPEQTARLFQAFSQADSSTTRKYGGTGLGLSISKRLVEMMEGSIWAESEYGHGSTFCFTAWFGVGAAEERQRSLVPCLSGVRALVVDDNPVAREILTDMLKQFSLQVEYVPSGNDALRELARTDSQDPYRLVLMDWHMPGMDGLETSRVIKSAGGLRNVPKIVLITAFGREDIRLQAEEMAIEGFLQKPVSPSVLFDTLMNLFGTARDEDAPTPLGRGDQTGCMIHGIRVLLVEDNEANQQVATELLESEGATVTIACHGGEAVRILTEGHQPPPFDVVLMDVQMPEMDGFTATRLLRAKAHLRKLPIIAMTAHVMAEEIQRCLESGMNDHVGKPIAPGAFFATLARWTRARQVETSVAQAAPAVKSDEAAFPEIQGVDVARGLLRIAGNRRLYRDLLIQFAAKQKFVSETIAKAIESRDRQRAERLAHSLKGVAGNLGINEAFEVATKLELAIRESGPEVTVLIEELASALDRQVRAIQAALPAASADDMAGRDARPADPSKVLSAIAKLKELLEASDADASGAYANLADLARGAVDAVRLEALHAAVNGFHFDVALNQLDEITKIYRPKEKPRE